ncbi:MAG TPA: 5-formyltetrahydrofolate cyclo-ligase [Candidatus Margulisbacteria bacterium]|nr:MAG: 5-formyltetrahydrofolate cyclo-ligase [Candidatus Margulisbacteria bacterium GWD2_39_127]HAR62153.1 5-formyltetrahydrofolate cyclo-ligase [Candidatus Margulisiibacteriota bacterium]
MKQAIRQSILEKRKNLYPEEVTILSTQIQNNLLKIEAINTSKTIFTYISCKNEVDTIALIKSWLPEKIIYVPYIIDANHSQMVPSKISSLKDIVTHTYGIPATQNLNADSINDIQITIVPGIAFDKQGHRVGFGKGFYDRILHNYHGIKIGLAYSFQIVDQLKSGSHDIPMDFIVTEKEIIHV